MTYVNAVNSFAEVGRHLGTRRARLRQSTEAEILATARAVVLEGGAGALSLREVGRRMGMTASALYRYYDGHAALVDALTAAMYDEIGQHLSEALHAAEVPAGASSQDRALCRLMAAAHAFRDWALVHPAEFGLTFGPSLSARLGNVCGERESEAGRRFGMIFAELFAEWAGDVLEPAAAAVPPAEVPGVMVSPLTPQGGRKFEILPPALDAIFVRSWVRLLGTVSVEVYGHLDYMGVIDRGAVFEAEMSACLVDMVAAMETAGHVSPVPGWLPRAGASKD